MLRVAQSKEWRTPKVRSVRPSCVFLVFWIQVYHQKQTAEKLNNLEWSYYVSKSHNGNIANASGATAQ